MDLPPPYTLLRALGPRTALVQDERGRPRVLKRARGARPDDIASLLLEAHRASRLPHAGFAPAEAVDTAGPAPYYLMPYLEGFAASAVPARRALDYARDLVARLAELHALGYVHAGLSPQHLRVLEGETLALVGYGRLTPIGQRAAFLPDGLAAPELARGLPLDPRADFFAVGQLLAGWLGRFDPALPHLAPFLAEDPAERPPDAMAALELLGELRTRVVPSPARPGASLETATPGMRHLGGRLALARAPLSLAELAGDPATAPSALFADWDRLLREGLLADRGPERYGLAREELAAYFERTMTPEARRNHHQALLRILEDRPDSPLVHLVAHAKGAQDVPSVVRWALPAGREALAAGNPEAAAEALEDGLAALARGDGRTGAFWLALATARRALGQRAEARAAFERALGETLTSRERLSALLAASSDPVAPERAALEAREARLAEALALAEHLEDAEARFIARALRLEVGQDCPAPPWLGAWLGESAPEAVSAGWLCRGRIAAGAVLARAGRDVEGLALIGQGLAGVEALPEPERLAAYVAALRPLRLSGRAATLARTASAMLGLARSRGEPELEASALMAYLEAALWVGAPEAISAARAALDGLPADAAPAQALRRERLGLRARVALGELEAALARVPAPPASTPEPGPDAFEQAALTLARAEACLAAGRLAEAAAWLESLPALEGEPLAARAALAGLLGEAQGALGPARRHYLQALAAESPPWQRRALEGLARIAGAEGHGLEADGWSDQAGRARAALMGPRAALWQAAAVEEKETP